ncbi:MAG: class I SAM-dependent methyltransferase [Acetobacteraceae bacterium]|nr:class I SAM-dependent methyltransferase [Acetobacteraceae bacterium]
MSGEVHGLPEFYAGPPGRVAARMLRRRLRELWPDCSGLDVAVLGWGAPYLGLWRNQPGKRLALAPAGLGPMAWTGRRGNAAATVQETHLPLPDRSLDRLLLVHALEASEQTRALLRECWRVLRDDGRLLAVAPNRLGWWSFFDHTPFGQGRPYSPGQLKGLLEAQLFHVRRRDSALCVPPFPWHFALKGAAAWEVAGRAVPRFAGLVLLEAEKDLFAALPAGAVAVRRRAVMPVPSGVRRDL